MENIAPSLILLWDVKRSLEKGQSLSIGIKNYLARPRRDLFAEQVESWWLSQTNSNIKFDRSKMNPTRKYLLEILEQGLKGQSILENLKGYESELILSCEEEISKHVAKLPLLLMIPLMGFIFPALMMLLIAPLLNTIQF